MKSKKEFIVDMALCQLHETDPQKQTDDVVIIENVYRSALTDFAKYLRSTGTEVNQSDIDDYYQLESTYPKP